MTALTTNPGCLATQKLIALLDEQLSPHPDARLLNFSERLDAIEVEAIIGQATPAALMLIRVAREMTEFTERIVGKSGRMTADQL